MAIRTTATRSVPSSLISKSSQLLLSAESTATSYRGHNFPDRFRVWIIGQVRRVTKVIRREMRRRAAVEPVIGHLKDDHRMRRNYLKGRDGDRINAVLAAAGYNFSLLLRWFEELLRVLLLIICRSRAPRLCLASLALGNILHGRHLKGGFGSAVTPHQCALPRLRRLSHACTSHLARLAKTQNLVAMNGRLGLSSARNSY